jgi:hypothetical protein
MGSDSWNLRICWTEEQQQFDLTARLAPGSPDKVQVGMALVAELAVGGAELVGDAADADAAGAQRAGVNIIVSARGKWRPDT